MEETKKNLDLITRYFTEFSAEQLRQFGMLDELYQEWNARINVISRKDTDGLYEKHVLHSLSIAATCDFAAGTQVIDLGTGGGFPGIPLAIFFPEVSFHLVDSIGKKIKVVEAVASEIGLKNVTTQHTRAEDIKNRKFHTVVSRAVAPLKDLWTWAKPLLKKNTPENPYPYAGLICLKGGDLAQEISDSGCRPKMVSIYKIFPEDYFKDKHLLYVPV